MEEQVEEAVEKQEEEAVVMEWQFDWREEEEEEWASRKRPIKIKEKRSKDRHLRQ